MLAELYTGYSNQQVNPHNIQHILMYSFFALNGFFDICVTKFKLDQPSAFNQPALLPDGVQRSTLIIALCAEFLLFAFHLAEKTDLEVLVHVLLLICNFFAISACALEWIYNDQPCAALARSFTALFKGVWFFQVL